jgi:dTDP-4-amino-4,6-dideoxygalactose transaminase
VTTGSSSTLRVADPGPVPFLDVDAGTRELRAALTAAIARVVDSGVYIGGPEVTRFEQEWSRYCGARAAVGVGNGLDALSLALRALGAGRGDLVAVPSWTFIATWLAISSVGATLLPVEVDPSTANLDPTALAAAFEHADVRAVFAVHLYGQPADMDAIGGLAAARGVPVIEDAAQAHGATWRGRRVGGLGAAAGFSFYPAKNLGALGDAGAVTSNDEGIIERVRILGNYGSAEKYDHVERGVNSRLDPLQAVVLRERLRVLDEWNARRASIAARYLEALADLHWLELPRVIDGAGAVWHLFVVRTSQRDALRDHLGASGVATGLHYPIANHRSGAYAAEGFRLPIADRLAAESLSLPIGPHLSVGDTDRVIDAVRSFRA